MSASAALAVALFAARTGTAGSILYVDDDAAAAGDGSSWAAAHRFLADALASAALPASGITEIRVAAGRYTPDRDELHPAGTGDRDATFQLIDGVTLSGGYAGPGAPDPDERNIAAHLTTLSGDLLGDDSPRFDATHAENSYTVVTGSGTGATAVLDGFVIGGGTASGPSGGPVHLRNAGGMLNVAGSPTVVDCTIAGNYARLSGGGAYNDGGSPALIGCTITGNLAQDGSGGGLYDTNGSDPSLTGCLIADNTAGFGTGGGICNTAGSSPTVTGCTFQDNAAAFSGGGMSNSVASHAVVVGCTFSGNAALDFLGDGGALFNRQGSSPIVVGCVFAANEAGHNGGAIGNYDDASPTVLNCLFDGNSAGDWGGAIRAGVGCSPVIGSCAFVGNQSQAGGAVAAGAATAGPIGHTTLANCILWSSSAPQGHELALIGNEPAQMTVTFSDVQGGQAAVHVQAGFTLNWGGGNIDADPAFADSDGPDDDPGTWQDNDLRPGPGSPCIDAGDNTAVAPDSIDLDGDVDLSEPLPLDLDLQPRFADDACRADSGIPGPPGSPVDIGAYEFQSTSCDANGDGQVAVNDLLILLAAWGPCPAPCPPHCPADFNGDCNVSVIDLLALLAAWD